MSEALKTALRAIRARVRGEFDNPDLLAFGPLSTVSDDCEEIATRALMVPAPDPLDTPVCPRCGSHEVKQDATAVYDRDTGTWVIADHCDTLYCNVCGEIGETVTLRHFRPRG